MYLRRVRLSGGGDHYLLRESYRDNGCWRSRDLLDLGNNPAEHIHYPGGNGFYFNPEIEERLDSMGAIYTSEELEEALMPFIEPGIRQVLEKFQWMRRTPHLSTACPKEEAWAYEKELHLFDKRRLHFLRFGRIDIGDLGGRSWKFLNVLLCKCRDEIEAFLEMRERNLSPGEIIPYVYASLDLQSHFPGHLLRHHPAALDPGKVDEFFLEELCRLNADASFFAGMDSYNGSALHPYLARYAVFYFDNTLQSDMSWEEFINRFRRFRQFHQVPAGKSTLGLEEAYKVFGLSEEEFRTLSVKELTRRYRRKAKKKHPDQGGDHDAFLRLTEAYEMLLARK